MTIGYGDFSGFMRFLVAKNKANSKPIAGLWPESLCFWMDLISYVDIKLILAD